MRVALAALLLALGATVAARAEEPRPAPAPPASPADLRLPALAPAAERPAGRRPGAREVLRTQAGADRAEWIVDGLDEGQRLTLLGLLARRGHRAVALERWPAAPAARDPDLVALLEGQGRLPPGHVPHGQRAPVPLPPLWVLGGRLALELHEGEARAVVLEALPGSTLANIGLTVGDAVLTIDGRPVDPRGLLGLGLPERPGVQRTLRVRRTHGGIEQIVLAAWVRAADDPSARPGPR